MGLPVGPNRVRAGDGDRERVVAFIRGHWAEGRLTDQELDQRLGKALRARTLGDLRKLIADLPVPSTTSGQKARRGAGYLARALKTVRGVVVAVGFSGVVLAIIGAIVGPQEQTATTAAPAEATATPDVPAPAPKVTQAGIGEPAVDGGVEFRVLRIRGAESVALRADRGGGRLAAGENRRFFVAGVRVANQGSTPEDTFCGSGGATLHVAAGEDVEPIADLYQLEGNEAICAGGVQPGQSATLTLVFKVPEGDEALRIDVWNNGEEGDILGKTRIRVAT